LGSNQLKETGAFELSGTIRMNRSLSTLNLRKNEINQRGGEQLVESLQLNQTLKAMPADGNEFYPRYIDKL
jgi:hypothetical protein